MRIRPQVFLKVFATGLGYFISIHFFVYISFGLSKNFLYGVDLLIHASCGRDPSGVHFIAVAGELLTSGDYEICIAVKQPIRVILSIYAEVVGNYFQRLENLLQVGDITTNSTDAVRRLTENIFRIELSIRFSNVISSRDEMVQQRNSFYIKTYVLVFCTTAIIVAIVQVGIVRGMFYVDPRKIRV